MTYSILSLATGNILESYGSEELALLAMSRMSDAQEAEESLALVSFAPDGHVVSSLAGPELAAMVEHGHQGESH